MKPNNYDIPGYKFFLVKPVRKYTAEEDTIKRFSSICEVLEQDNSYNSYRLIPFEEVDGLTISDLDSIVGGKIFIACYVSIPSLNESFYHSAILYRVFSDTDFGRKVKETTVIDEYVTQKIQEKYDSASNLERRVYDCFLTRYGSEAYVKQKH